MRLFLAVFLFDMAVHCLLVMTGICSTFEDDVDRYPKKALPTDAERRAIAAGERPGGADSYVARWRECADSLVEFFDPRPKPELEAKLETNFDVLQYAATWYKRRSDFLGHLVGVDQNWPMFSPNVGVEDTMARFRLIYDDGSETVVRTICDPPDLCRYSHWFEEKHLEVATRLHKDKEARLGYCRMLANRYPTNAAGARLVRIDVFKVNYDYPSVDDDAESFLRQQSGPPEQQVEKPFWRYHVDRQKGESL
jgi:hypothetical protein